MNKGDAAVTPGLAAPDYTKLRAYLISAITREMEAANPALDQRQAVISKSLAEAYAQTRLQLSDSIREKLFQDIRDEILGYGPIQPLLDDPGITEVMVNGPKKVYVEKKGLLTKTNIVFDDNEHVQRIIDRIILPLGRRVDADSPMVDARLPDGSRVNAIIPPVAIDGPSITIRKFSKDKLTISQLTEYGSITAGMAEQNTAAAQGVSAAADNVKAQIAQVSASADSLTQLAGELQTMLAHFQISDATQAETISVPAAITARAKDA